jgi:hypothetical protein
MTAIRNILIITLFLALSSFHRPANLGDLIESMRTGDAGRITVYLDQSVDLNVPGHSGAYSKSEAKKMIQLFFAQHPLKTFRIIHQADIGGSKMLVGTMFTQNATFRTTLLFHEKTGAQVLKELRFE